MVWLGLEPRAGKATFCLKTDGENNGCIPPTLEGWVYIIPIHGPLDGPLYTWAQYTPTKWLDSDLILVFNDGCLCICFRRYLLRKLKVLRTMVTFFILEYHPLVDLCKRLTKVSLSLLNQIVIFK